MFLLAPLSLVGLVHGDRSPLGFNVVDAHVHLISTTNGIEYLWTKPTPPSNCPCPPPCFCNWTRADFVATSKPVFTVDTAIFCEVDAAHDDWLKEVSWIQKMADADVADVAGVATASTGGAGRVLPRIGAIIAQPPLAMTNGQSPVSSYAEQLDALQQLPLVTGVRPNFLPNASEPLLIAALQEMGRRKLVVDLNYVGLDVMAGWIKQCPGTTFVIEHMGSSPDTTNTSAAAFDAWEAGIKTLASFENVECFQLGGLMSAWGKVGAVDDDAVKKWTKSAIRVWGFQRLCFEGNWFFNNWRPPHTNLDVYSKWGTILLEIFDEVKASPADVKAALRDNSLRVYRAKNKH